MNWCIYFLLTSAAYAIVLKSMKSTKTLISRKPRLNLCMSTNPSDNKSNGYREKAQLHFQERSRLFNEAENARRNGNSLYATELSQQAHWHNEEMKLANHKAVIKIISAQSNKVREVDLHGLYVSEAIEVVEYYVAKHAGQVINVITGIGLNSDVSRGPKLYPAIVKLCEDNAWRYSGGYGYGSVSITCPKSETFLDPVDVPYEGLVVGEKLPDEIWDNLLTAAGDKFKYSFFDATTKVLLVYVDPRAFSYRTKIVTEEFQKLSTILKSCTLAIVTCDSPSDLKKMTKKKKESNLLLLLSNPNKNFMTAVKCKTKDKLLSMLMMVDFRSRQVLRIWYEDMWEVEETHELLLDQFEDISD